MPELDLVFIAILYFAQVGILLLGLRRAKDSTSSVSAPFVSVVVAARNEENNLPECLNSLAHQTYPTDKFEIIVADDASTDRTAAICAQYEETHANMKSFVTVESPGLRGKPNALAQAIDRAQGEVVLITDADCTVPPTWIEATANRFTPEVGLVGGITLQHSDNAFQGMQSLDWAYILGVAAASAALGKPLGSIGNNLSFRKQAYDEVGGYRKIQFSVTEDYSLVQAILGTKHWKFLYPIDEKVLVESQPCPTLRSLIQQKHRWGKGGLDMKFWGFVIMTVGFSMHAALLWHFVWYSFATTGAVLLLKMIADYIFLYHILARLNRTHEIRFFYWFEIYYTLYVLALPFLVFFGGKVHWKGRNY